MLSPLAAFGSYWSEFPRGIQMHAEGSHISFAHTHTRTHTPPTPPHTQSLWKRGRNGHCLRCNPPLVFLSQGVGGWLAGKLVILLSPHPQHQDNTCHSVRLFHVCFGAHT